MGGFDGGPASRSPPLHDRRGRTLSPIQTLSTAIKSYEPDVAPAADGSFVAVNTKISQSVPHLHVHVVPRRKGDGLRGFFWPRTKYASDEEAAAYAARIAAALPVS